MNKDINLTDGAVTEVLNNKVDIDFQNVPSNSVGFARCSTEVTNCITEIPQRIKYTLVDGTLTIKAGSVVIVPYGVEDLTSQYPKGSTFLHENLRVYDTQFADNKFFVWAELQIDLSKSTTDDKEDLMPQIYIDTTLNELVLTAHYVSNYASGETPPTNFKVYYNTLTNTLKATTLLERTYSFPIMLTSDTFTSIKQVFNGMGYIGSAVWVDKGVKGLIPNGRNEDGTLNNIEYVTPTLITYNMIDTSEVERHIIIGIDTMLYLKNYAYDATKNYVFNNKGGTVYQGFLLTTYLNSENGILSFNVNQPLKLADYSQTCGQWVYKHQLLLETTALKVDTHIYNFDLSDYLPKDDYPYEVLYVTDGNTGGTTGAELSMYAFLGDGSEAMVVARARTRTSGSVCAAGNCVVTVTQKRNLKVTFKVLTAASGNIYARVLGYRRSPKNL